MTTGTNKTVDLVRAAREKLEKARADVEDAKARVLRYESFLAVVDELGAVRTRPVRGVRAKPRRPARLDQHGLSIVAAAELVLREAHTPLKNRQIAELMLEGGYRYEKGLAKLRGSVGAMLDRDAKNGKRFRKVAPGVFTLREIGEPPHQPELIRGL